ncbi:LPXTG cell wall anchor domain-containing protein [Microbacterium sp. NIBRBAC000506063]|uniref:LPXTG cell wall anchor domain-containing protein n=1 Tax=Microbacterium sp. NIBRBAC000506063 TaxID=2734618 RepID=UPI001CB70B8C|nr:LPXTG cell wall anchor domain-containing protein [Microbacterium sp. NIBRBAC000506063]
MLIGSGVLDAQGRITVTIPADAELGTHRIAVYDSEGELLGWTEIQVTAAGSGTGERLPDTGSDIPFGAMAIALLLLAGGGLAVLVRRRSRIG